MTENDLVSIIRSHRDGALGVEDGQLTTERANALDHYHGRPYGNEVEGRSQVVSRDLAEAVDWAMPGLMRVFVQAGVLAEFTPVGPEDTEGAAQESDYVNQVMMKDNAGFMVLHDAIKDTLLLKNGYTKQLWEAEDKISDESYTDLSLDQITMMLGEMEKSGAEVEVVGQDSRIVPVPGMPQEQNEAQAIMTPATMELFDVKLRVKRKTGRAIWTAVPTEEVRVSKKCRGSLRESPFTEHVTKKTRSDLIEMGMPRSFVDTLPAHNETANSSQAFARDSVDDESDDTGSATGDRSMDEIEFCEAYLKVDWDGDGVAEMRKVVTCANRIPPGEQWNEPIPVTPLSAWVAKRVPHRHVGESLDDELADLQEIMTVLKRQLLDNIYLNNNAETVINEDANLRDFMTRMPGGIKRVKGSQPVQSAVMPLITKPIIGDILPVIDFFDQAKQRRSGIDGPNTGVDPDVLQQTTKGAFIENLNRASQKMEMIARMLGETGVKDAVLQMHGLLLRHQDVARMVQLRGKWVQINPQEWKERTDLNLKIGLGTGTEEDKRMKLQLLSGLQAQLMQVIGAAPPSVYARMYAMFEDVAKTLAIEAPEKYAIPPGSQEHAEILQQAQQQAQQGQGGADLAKAAQIQGEADMRVQQMKLEANAQVQAAEDRFKRDKETFIQRFEAMDRDAERRHEMVMQAQELRSKEAVEAMKQEVQLLLKSMFADLGATGLSAGVQGSQGMMPPEMQQPATQSQPPEQPTV